ncbi:hypothetical protein PRIPAC_89543 [Pristionchus pacificus]|nr:hypothetical protein PRIPAC_89543 [Pristionchus pacificus]
MMMYHFLLLLLFPSTIENFVYSCEDTIQLVNSSFEQYTNYAFVVTEQGFTNWTQLDNIYLVNDDDQYSFSDVADKGKQEGSGPWTIIGYDLDMECAEEIALILTSDDLPVYKLTDGINKYVSASAILVTPKNGMWINKNSMRGNGNVTVYTGAGIGEAEYRYFMQSWTCNSMPDWIWLFANVITIEIESSCSLILTCSTDIEASAPAVYRHDKIAIHSSERSDNAPNRHGIDLSAQNEIGDLYILLCK